MKKKQRPKIRDIFSFILSEDGLDILSIVISFGILSIVVKKGYSIILQIGIALIALFLCYKIHMCFEAREKVSKLEYKIEKLEKELTSCQDYSREKTEEITKLKNALDKSDNLILKILDSQKEKD